MRREVVFDIRLRVAKRHVMLLQQRVYLKASVQFEEPADLSLGEPTSTIALNGDGFERRVSEDDFLEKIAEYRRELDEEEAAK